MMLPNQNYRIYEQDRLGAGTSINALLDAWKVLAWDVANTVDLDWAYFGGLLRANNLLLTQADGAVTLVDNDWNFIEIDTTGNVTCNITGFTAGRLQIARVQTMYGQIVQAIDCRTWLGWDVSSPGGGLPPNTQDGTFLVGWGAAWHEAFIVTNAAGEVVTNSDGLVVVSEV